MRGSELLWRALGLARRANLAAAGEAAPVRGSAAPARRAVLKALGGAALVGAAPLPVRAIAADTRVAIIGGGIAGLAALMHLRDAGIDARLYEARNRLGGRIATRRLADGAVFEDGAQLVNSDHADLQALARRFGIALVDRKDSPHRSLVLANGRAVDEGALAEALRPIAAQIASDADRLDRDYAAVAAELDRLSVAAYLDRHAALLPEPWVRDLLAMSCRTEYGAEPHDATALELVFNLPTVGSERVEVLGGSDERYVIEGGSSRLIEAMAAGLGAAVHFGRRATRIERAGAGYRVAFLDGSEVMADRVIVAVPAPILRQLDLAVPLPALWRSYIAAAELGRNEKLHAVATQPAWADTIGRGGELWQTDAAAGYALGWDGSVAGTGSTAWTWFLGGDQAHAGSGEAAAFTGRAFAATADAALPGLAAAQTGPWRRTAWHRDALTLGAYSNFRPGQLTRFARLFWLESDDPAERQMAAAGGLVFAGEHLSDAWPGYMNGGAQTGRLAAETVLAAIGARRAA
ncbi:flavin monoamine oxidase family protein [Sphingomonas baiyangensis]|uniref:Amine oxidase n=1 Tax=Sphingomonas baiyangensis TaxID=2572576 RepID=A0A4U1LA04_9SPHN|nr:NAD(P)/FAD-dependent oxidoreductase [Sphingomonas baiyangensis]TKD53240.1 amine oxidase [Sphingomonas baiyangensis]